MCGWVASRRDHGGVVFLDLRDTAGIVQVVVDPKAHAGCRPARHPVREYVLRIEGAVRDRPRGHRQPRARRPARSRSPPRRVEVLNAADPPPIPIDDRVEADEVLRLRYRYLDLRSARLQRNLRLRADGEPALCVPRSTPRASSRSRRRCSSRRRPKAPATSSFRRGSRPGSFYALPQSPQLFKQLLMVGGLDRYYQIARCLRDEDLRADRQFEFMQLDAEMSFADADDVMAVIGERSRPRPRR